MNEYKVEIGCPVAQDLVGWGKERELSDRARADTSAPGSSSWLSNMEFSSNSMTDNSFDKDNPLKQVLQLCSTLAGKGCDFSISVRIRDT